MKNVVAQKLRIAMVKSGDMKFPELSELTCCPYQGLLTKFKRNNFRERDLRRIAEALGYDVEIVLTSMETGEKV